MEVLKILAKRGELVRLCEQVHGMPPDMNPSSAWANKLSPCTVYACREVLLAILFSRLKLILELW